VIRRSAIVTIAITLGQLAAGKRSGWSEEQILVLEALRRSTARLDEASEQELADYLKGMSPEQMAGVVSNVKGIFHELLVKRAENLNGDDVTAVMMELTNHPGADLEYVMNGEIIGSVQLKAVQTPAAIIEHFSRYPDIDVLATSEVTALLSGVFGERLRDSEFRNEDLTQIARDTLNELAGVDMADFVQDGFATSALVCGALQARALLQGQKPSPEQVRSSLELAGIGVGTAVTVDALINML
jgi:hypothetical protein